MVSELGSKGVAMLVTHPLCPSKLPLSTKVSAMLAAGLGLVRVSSSHAKERALAARKGKLQGRSLTPISRP